MSREGRGIYYLEKVSVRSSETSGRENDRERENKIGP